MWFVNVNRDAALAQSFSCCKRVGLWVLYRFVKCWSWYTADSSPACMLYNQVSWQSSAGRAKTVSNWIARPFLNFAINKLFTWHLSTSAQAAWSQVTLPPPSYRLCLNREIHTPTSMLLDMYLTKLIRHIYSFWYESTFKV